MATFRHKSLILSLGLLAPVLAQKSGTVTSTASAATTTDAPTTSVVSTTSITATTGTLGTHESSTQIYNATCSCQNGVLGDAYLCTKIPGSGSYQTCESCNYGYHLNQTDPGYDFLQACTPNVCKCPNGYPLNNGTCPADNAQGCLVCDLFYQNVGGQYCVEESGQSSCNDVVDKYNTVVNTLRNNHLNCFNATRGLDGTVCQGYGTTEECATFCTDFDKIQDDWRKQIKQTYPNVDISDPFHYYCYECTCANGIAKEDCIVNFSPYGNQTTGDNCESCYPGYRKNAHTQACDPINCACPNGVPLHDGSCLEEYQIGCMTCNFGYYLDKDQALCLPNQCECENGIALPNGQCPINNAAGCLICNVGYVNVNSACVVQPVTNCNLEATKYNTILENYLSKDPNNCVQPGACSCNGTLSDITTLQTTLAITTTFSTDSATPTSATLLTSSPGNGTFDNNCLSYCAVLDEISTELFVSVNSTCPQLPHNNTCGFGLAPTSCDFGYYLDKHQGLCLPNKCECENGIALSNGQCPVDNSEGCLICKIGYVKYGNGCVAQPFTNCNLEAAKYNTFLEDYLSQDPNNCVLPGACSCNATNEFTNSTTLQTTLAITTTSSPGNVTDGNVCSSYCAILDEVSAEMYHSVNTTCPQLPHNNTCGFGLAPTSCEFGYYLDKNQGRCLPNKCNCENGIPLSNGKCPANNTEGCVICNAGFVKIANDCVVQPNTNCNFEAAKYNTFLEDYLSQDPDNCVSPGTCSCNATFIDSTTLQTTLAITTTSSPGNATAGNVCLSYCSILDQVNTQMFNSVNSTCPQLPHNNTCGFGMAPTSCNFGYYLDQNQAACLPNKCQCENGIALPTGQCPTNNSTGCVICNVGYVKIADGCVAQPVTNCNLEASKYNDFLADYLSQDPDDCVQPGTCSCNTTLANSTTLQTTLAMTTTSSSGNSTTMTTTGNVCSSYCAVLDEISTEMFNTVINTCPQLPHNNTCAIGMGPNSRNGPTCPFGQFYNTNLTVPTCEFNTCNCPNGIPVGLGYCPINEGMGCLLCNPGYINIDGIRCVQQPVKNCNLEAAKYNTILTDFLDNDPNECVPAGTCSCNPDATTATATTNTYTQTGSTMEMSTMTTDFMNTTVSMTTSGSMTTTGIYNTTMAMANTTFGDCTVYCLILNDITVGMYDAINSTCPHLRHNGTCGFNYLPDVAPPQPDNNNSAFLFSFSVMLLVILQSLSYLL